METGIDELADLLESMFLSGKVSFNEEVYLDQCPSETRDGRGGRKSEKVQESISLGMPEDFYSIDLMDAYESLGSITGESVGEDLVNEIFSKFCMGK